MLIILDIDSHFESRKILNF